MFTVRSEGAQYLVQHIHTLFQLEQHQSDLPQGSTNSSLHHGNSGSISSGNQSEADGDQTIVLILSLFGVSQVKCGCKYRLNYPPVISPKGTLMLKSAHEKLCFCFHRLIK